ncbi:aspartic peptidase A1 [Phlegmacium glaucopus]|nr:aspartic peptidase A1 [Phlegmacium glaucopus]
MLSSPVSAVILLCLSVQTSAAPQSGTGQTMALKKRAPSPKTMDDWGIWAKNNRQGLEAKYGDDPLHKRATGTNLMTNQNGDSSYFGSLAIGTPPKSYSVILDTGSADLWVADSLCTTGCSSVPTFDSSASSTFQNQSAPFSITYGSGQAAGSLGGDVIQMAGYSVPNQIFAVCNQVSPGLLAKPVSGLLGLAFQTIASSRAMPLWQTLVSGGAWDSPLMSFHLTRYINSTSILAEEPGGSFSMGFTNSTINVQGTSIRLPSGQSSYAAIDTGTTLVGGPPQYISEIFAQIPGSSPGTGDFQNYYTYPCNTTVNVQMSFGGKNWTISPADFQLSKLTRTQCLGAFFELTTGSSAPSWIVGDTFLKNVYSVFRYDPLSIGFAQLSDTALAENGSDGEAPTPTIGSAAATVSATAPRSNPTKLRNHASAQTLIPMAAIWTASVAAGYML